MEGKRIVLLTGAGLEHRYVANKLAADLPLAGIIVDVGKPLHAFDRYKQLFRRYTIPQLVSRLALAIFRSVSGYKSRRQALLTSVFGIENCQDFLHPVLLHRIQGINSTAGESTVAALRPDILLVFGTGIVGNKVLSLARQIALNMHTGISPYYRGCDCAFWPLHNEEPYMLGATVHECTKEIDGGKILGTIRAELCPDDSVFSVFARCVTAGTKLYVDTVRQVVSGDPTFVRQDLSLGTEYRAYKRGLSAELRALYNVRKGLIKTYVQSSAAETKVRRTCLTPDN